MKASTIVVVGAGSASFGLNTLATLFRNEKLKGSNLRLVDKKLQPLSLVEQLAHRLNREWDAQMRISAFDNHKGALSEADFVVLSIEVSPREKLWQLDFEIPLKYGIRQPYAENGGPGGFAHALRNIPPVMEIIKDMEKSCPDAWVINFTNPMIRICDAISRYSSIKVVGLCHQIMAGYAMVGKALAKDLGIQVPEEFTSCASDPITNAFRKRVAQETYKKVEISAAGINHFTWMLALTDRDTGQDLYPLFAKRWQELDPQFEPLTREIYDIFGIFPIPGDEHLCEYLPWMSNSLTRPWEKYAINLYEWTQWANNRSAGIQEIAEMAQGEMPIEPLQNIQSEGAAEIITHLTNKEKYPLAAVNLPNNGQIDNLPENAIVETPGVIDLGKINPLKIGALPNAVAELCRQEVARAQLCVDAAVSGDRQAALYSLLLDPVINDIDTARQILDNYLNAYRNQLPIFWS